MTEWHVKYDGNCARCGTRLVRGTPAVWDRAKRVMRCVECPSPSAGSTDSRPIEAGVGGASAWREYERRRAKRETRIDERWGRLSGVVKALTSEPTSTTAWAIGARGEAKLAAELAKVDGLRVLNDRRVRGTRGNIDHLVIGPAGVFVVDAKTYSGLIRIRDVGGFFRRDDRLYVGRRDCSKLARNMGWQVQAVTRVLQGAGVDPVPPITPVLCFIEGEWPLFRAPSSFERVRLEGTGSIKKLVSQPPLLDPAEIARQFRILASAFPPK